MEARDLDTREREREGTEGLIRVLFSRYSCFCHRGYSSSDPLSYSSSLARLSITSSSVHGGHGDYGGSSNGVELPVLFQWSAQASSYAS